MAVHYRAHGPVQNGTTDVGHEVHEGRRQTSRRSVYGGRWLKLIVAPGRSRLTGQPSSRNEENSPCGMIGGIVETSGKLNPGPRLDPTRPTVETNISRRVTVRSAGG